jgi:hypothetical protein
MADDDTIHDVEPAIIEKVDSGGISDLSEEEILGATPGLPVDMERSIVAIPQRISIWEFENLENVVIPDLNPTEFEDETEMDWNRFTSPGGSYAHMHYNSTRNYVVELQLYFHSTTELELKRNLRCRRLLQSWCYPKRALANIRQGPPELILYWPGSLSLRCYLVGLRFSNVRFALDGRVTRWSATVKLEENRDAFVAQQDISSTLALHGGD